MSKTMTCANIHISLHICTESGQSLRFPHEGALHARLPRVLSDDLDQTVADVGFAVLRLYSYYVSL